MCFCFLFSNRRRTSKLLHRSTGRTQSSAEVRVTSLTQSICRINSLKRIEFNFFLSAAAGNLQSPGAAVLSPSAPVVNGVQPAAHQNGVSANGEAADFEEIIQLNNGGNPTQTQSGLVGEPILAFEGGEPFLMKTGPMKPQHVAGKDTDAHFCLKQIHVSVFLALTVVWQDSNRRSNTMFYSMLCSFHVVSFEGHVNVETADDIQYFTRKI